MRNVKKAVVLILSAALVCACSVYKEYSRPETIPTDDLYGIRCLDTTSIAQIGWEDFFTDPKLQSLIRKGLENNRDVRIASQKIIEAEAALTQARLSLFPTLNFSPSFSFAESDVRYGGSVQGYSLSPAAVWEADLRGSLQNAKRKAQAAYEQSEIYKKSVETELVSAIARAYYSLQMLDSKLNISRQTADSWKENVRIMKAMKDAGMVNEASVAQTEANSCSIEASLFDLQYQIRQVENKICGLIGDAPHGIDRSQFSKSAINQDIMLGVPAQLLARRPDVMVSEYNLRKAFYDTNIAQAAFYPSIKLTGAYGWEKALTGAAGALLSAGASLAEPIFNAGHNRANLRIAKAQQEEALLSFEKTLISAGAEVNDAVAKCQAAQGKTDLRIQQIQDLKSAVNSTQQLMHNSGATYLEVLTAQQSLLSAQLLQVSDQYDAIDGMISLYKALGGGF